jgi:hypothetical protein
MFPLPKCSVCIVGPKLPEAGAVDMLGPDHFATATACEVTV